MAPVVHYGLRHPGASTIRILSEYCVNSDYLPQLGDRIVN